MFLKGHFPEELYELDHFYTGRERSKMTPLYELFDDKTLCEKIQRKLPFLFALAEQQASRARRIGMEVGTLREQILIALLIYKFGENNVNLDIPITEHELDVQLKGFPLSIKTVTATSRSIPAIKIVWTVDWEQVKNFAEKYKPKCDILLVVIRWGKEGGLYGIPLQAQQEVFENLGKWQYLKVPKRGTNPRGVEISSLALETLIKHRLTKSLPINWQRPSELDLKEALLAPYKRWLYYWQSD
jgi:hypothetical protein